MKSKVLARLGAGAFVLVTSALMAQSYSVTDIGAFSGGNTVASKLNLTGLAVGQSGKMYGVNTRAFVLTSGKLQNIGTLPGGDYSSAFDVNTNGTVIGDSNTANNIHAFLWSMPGGLQDLGTLPGDTASRAFGISDNDQVVGYSSGAGGVTAFLWSKSAGMTSLGTLRNGSYSTGNSVNKAGSVVGVSLNSAGDKHAFLWNSDKGMQDLGTLSGYSTSEAHKINSGGDIVGSSTGTSGTRAVLWSAGGAAQSLGTLGSDYSNALDLDDNGDIVGSSTSAMGAHAFLWSKKVGMRDLNELISTDAGVVLTSAIGINNSGQILAIGAATTDRSQPLQMDDTHHHAGPTHTYLLQPVR